MVNGLKKLVSTALEVHAASAHAGWGLAVELAGLMRMVMAVLAKVMWSNHSANSILAKTNLNLWE